MHFPDSHTSQNISEYLQGLKSFGIPKNKIHLVVRDNGPNMVAGVRKSGLVSKPCFIHTMQLCIHDSILCQKSVKDILSTCRNISSHFHHSATAAAKLFTIQVQLNAKQHKLIQDVSTRWNSSYDMLKRMFEQKIPLATYAAEHSLKTLTDFQWQIVEKLFQVLEPFANITKICSNREETVAQIIPSILTLNVLLNKGINSKSFNGIITLVEEHKNSVERRLNKFLSERALCITTFLDPRFKLTFQHESDNSVKDMIIEASDDDTSAGGIDAEGPTFISLKDCYMEIAASKSSSSETIEISGPKRMLHSSGSELVKPKKGKKSHMVLNQEINKYVSLPILSSEDSQTSNSLRLVEN